MIKTRTKVVHKKVSQGCNKIRKSKGIRITQPLYDIQVNLFDLESRTLRTLYKAIILIVFNDIFIKIG